MKILLLTDVPPCKEFSGSLLTLQLCRFLPKDAVVCYSVVNPCLEEILRSSEFDIPSARMRKPREDGFRHKYKTIGAAISFLNETYNVLIEMPKILKSIVAFGRAHQVDRVWCILQGQTMIRLALPVASQLGVPLLTQIWDHPSWWFDAHNVDPITSRVVGRLYDRTLRKSNRIGAASFVMADEYQNKYGTPAIPLIGSIATNLVLPPARDMPFLHANRDTLLIGIAGQIYSKQEWNTLLGALNSIGWTLAGKNVRIRFLGRDHELNGTQVGPGQIEKLGYQPQDKTIRYMSECDILYCPYFFDEQRKEISKTSFPSKLSTYLAAGRPVFYHGPDYGSPSIFLKEHDAAAFCHSLHQDDIVRNLSRLVSDVKYYRTIANNGHDAIKKHLTFDSLKSYFEEFIGSSEN